MVAVICGWKGGLVGGVRVGVKGRMGGFGVGEEFGRRSRNDGEERNGYSKIWEHGRRS